MSCIPTVSRCWARTLRGGSASAAPPVTSCRRVKELRMARLRPSIFRKSLPLRRRGWIPGFPSENATALVSAPELFDVRIAHGIVRWLHAQALPESEPDKRQHQYDAAQACQLMPAHAFLLGSSIEVTPLAG